MELSSSQKALCSDHGQQSDTLERLQKLYQRTEELKEASKGADIEDQFTYLRDRLKNSAGFLNHIQKSIQNIKFAYQKNIVDLEEMAGRDKYDIDKEIEDIREHIVKLQSKAPQGGKKKYDHLTYQDALNDVMTTFQELSQGRYNSRSNK